MADYSGALMALAGYLNERKNKKQQQWQNKQAQEAADREQARLDLLARELNLKEQDSQRQYELQAGRDQTERLKVYRGDLNALDVLRSDPNRMAALRASNPTYVQSLEERARRAQIAISREEGGGTVPLSPSPNTTFGLSEAIKGAFPSLTLTLPARPGIGAGAIPPAEPSEPTAPSPPAASRAPFTITSKGIFRNLPEGMLGPPTPNSRLAPELRFGAIPPPLPPRQERPQEVVAQPLTYDQRLKQWTDQGFTPDYAAAIEKERSGAQEAAARTRESDARIASLKSGDNRANRAFDLQEWLTKKEVGFKQWEQKQREREFNVNTDLAKEGLKLQRSAQSLQKYSNQTARIAALAGKTLSEAQAKEILAGLDTNIPGLPKRMIELLKELRQATLVPKTDMFRQIVGWEVNPQYAAELDSVVKQAIGAVGRYTDSLQQTEAHVGEVKKELSSDFGRTRFLNRYREARQNDPKEAARLSGLLQKAVGTTPEKYFSTKK